MTQIRFQDKWWDSRGSFHQGAHESNTPLRFVLHVGQMELRLLMPVCWPAQWGCVREWWAHKRSCRAVQRQSHWCHFMCFSSLFQRRILAGIFFIVCWDVPLGPTENTSPVLLRTKLAAVLCHIWFCSLMFVGSLFCGAGFCCWIDNKTCSHAFVSNYDSFALPLRHAVTAVCVRPSKSVTKLFSIAELEK